MNLTLVFSPDSFGKFCYLRSVIWFWGGGFCSDSSMNFFITTKLVIGLFFVWREVFLLAVKFIMLFCGQLDARTSLFAVFSSQICLLSPLLFSVRRGWRSGWWVDKEHCVLGWRWKWQGKCLDQLSMNIFPHPSLPFLAVMAEIKCNDVLWK